MKDSHMQHKKRIAEMMASLMKDLSEVGTVMGNNSVDVKVCVSINPFSVRMLFRCQFVYLCELTASFLFSYYRDLIQTMLYKTCTMQ